MIDSDVKNLQGEKHRFLSGGGEMGALTLAKDWSKTSLGNPGTWPQSLRTTLGIVLNSKFPMFLWWGPELICFYNDAYRPSLGQNGKHPGILGIPAHIAWPEIWDIIKPLIDQVLAGGEATWSEDQLIPIFRNGKIEDVYWTFSYSAVSDETGIVAGVLVTCNETTEKVNTLIKLEESRNEVEFAINAAELGTFDYNPLTNKFSANERLKDWFGLSPGRDIDLQLALDAIDENDREKVTAAIQDTLNFSSGAGYDIEYTIINPVNKIKRIVNAKGKAWFNEQKIAYRLNGTVQDVTAQVTSRKRIEENEEDLRSMVLQSPVGICVLDAATLTSEIVNNSFIEVAGKPYEAIAGKYYWDTFAEARPYYEDALNQVVEKGIPFYANEVELMLIRHGKEEIVYVTFVYAPLKNAEGRVKKIAVWVLENTMQVKARQKIAEADKRFRDTVKQAPIGMTILRGDQYVVEMANNAYLELVDRKEVDFVGRPLFESLPEVESTVRQLLDDVFYTGTPFHGIEYPIPVNRYGKQELSYFNFLYYPLKEDDGQISGIIVTVTDVSESMKKKQMLAVREKQFRP
jgi:PAS domain-containing protein